MNHLKEVFTQPDFKSISSLLRTNQQAAQALQNFSEGSKFDFTSEFSFSIITPQIEQEFVEFMTQNLTFLPPQTNEEAINIARVDFIGSYLLETQWKNLSIACFYKEKIIGGAIGIARSSLQLLQPDSDQLDFTPYINEFTAIVGSQAMDIERSEDEVVLFHFYTEPKYQTSEVIKVLVWGVALLGYYNGLQAFSMVTMEPKLVVTAKIMPSMYYEVPHNDFVINGSRPLEGPGVSTFLYHKGNFSIQMGSHIKA